MVAIPRSALPHTAQLKSLASADSWGKREYGDPVELSYVRFEPTSKVVTDKENTQKQLTATMYFDCTNSQPAGQKFDDTGVIVFDGKEYTIAVVDTLYASGSSPHHYELGLA